MTNLKKYSLYDGEKFVHDLHCENDKRAVNELMKIVQCIDVFGDGIKTNYLLYNDDRLICNFLF